MTSAPFVIGQWVRGEKFYGRAELIEETLEGHRNWLWLLGTRRIGKTSLLKQLELLASTSQAESGRYFPVFWDFQGADSPEELHRGFREALLDAEDRLVRLKIDPAELEGADLFDALGRLRRKLRAADRKLLLLCDEVEELIKLDRKDPALLRKLRRSLQSQEDVRSVLASTIRLWALAEQRGDTSPFLHGFSPPLYIRGLADDEARALIHQSQLPRPSQPPFEEAIVEEIRSKCDNHPYLIQLVCKRLLELGDLGDAIEQVASDQMVSYFFSVDFEMLSPSERDVLRIVSEASSASSDSIQAHLASDSSGLTGVLRRLESLGYLRRNAERRFELINYFFKRWFRQQPLSSEPDGTRVQGLQATTRPSEKSTEPGGETRQLFDSRYDLVEEIGKGATGVVCKAFDTVLREMIAIKILKPEYSSNMELQERFRQEILLARDIGHPNILKVYHLGECSGQMYITMRWINGSTLASAIAREGPFPIDRTISVAWKMASALEAAHGRSVIHRDIKPHNILLDGTGEPYLVDFGLARLLTAPGTTRQGVFLGTPDYASPEQARKDRSDERSDIYALGVVIFEMATGKRPFRAETSNKVLQMHCHEPPPNPRQLRQGIPALLSELILRCLEKKPARRYPSARALRSALEELRSA